MKPWQQTILPWADWITLNRPRFEHNCCLSSKTKQGFITNDICECGVVQTMDHQLLCLNSSNLLLISWLSQQKRLLSVQDAPNIVTMTRKKGLQNYALSNKTRCEINNTGMIEKNLFAEDYYFPRPAQLLAEYEQ